MALNTPTPESKELVIYGKTIFLWYRVIFPTQTAIRIVEKVGNEFSFIDEIFIEPTLLINKEKTDEEFNKALEKINVIVKKVFSGSNNEPEKGNERMVWLINNLKVEDNKIING